MSVNVKPEIFLITGATSGLGKYLVEHVLTTREQALVIGIGRKEEVLTELSDRFNKRLMPLVFDLENVDGIKSALESLPCELKQVSTIFHCAGGSAGVRTKFPSGGECQKVMAINFFAATEINKIIIPLMEEVGHGRVLHIGSASGIEWTQQPAYSAAKLAIHAYVKCIGRTVLPSGVAVSGIIPGAFFAPGNAMDRFETFNPEGFEEFKKERVLTKNLPTAADFAPLIEHFLSPSGVIFSGSMIPVEAGLTKGIR
jgi:NAD(P)-dependent dehydrogenase (short-subunit alcohol dehydrogenase family)